MDRFSIAVIQEDCLSDDLYCHINLWIWRIVPRAIISLGTFGNVTNIAVFCRKALRSKPLVVLALLSAFDLMYLWLNEITSWNMFEPGTTEDELFNKVMSYLLMVGIFCSNWTIAIFTIERLAAIFFPVIGELFCTTRKTVTVVVFMMASKYIFAGIVMLGYQRFLPYENKAQIGNESDQACPFLSSEFVEYCDILRVFILGTSTVLPLLVAITGNTALVIKFLCCKSTTLLNSRPDTQTKMLFAVTGFLSATMIATAVGVYLRFQTLDGKEVSHTLRLITIVLHIIHLSNYSFNFFVYLLTGKVFKAEFKQMCKEIKKWLFGGK